MNRWLHPELEEALAIPVNQWSRYGTSGEAYSAQYNEEYSFVLRPTEIEGWVHWDIAGGKYDTWRDPRIATLHENVEKQYKTAPQATPKRRTLLQLLGF